jgi:hypothetical protein
MSKNKYIYNLACSHMAQRKGVTVGGGWKNGLNYFMCKELCLVIEVDGVTHLDEEVIEKDKIKQRNKEILVN